MLADKAEGYSLAASGRKLVYRTGASAVVIPSVGKAEPGKGRLALGKLSGRGDAGAALLVASPYGDNPAEAEARLLGLLQAARPTLNPILDGSAPQP